MRAFLAAAAAAALLAGLCGCACVRTLPPQTASFAEYVLETKARIAANRRFATADHEAEVERMTPWEMRPDYPDGRAVLFLHGLGESPWSFRDTGKRLAQAGILVRAILIPGHGTKPEDMLEADGDEWLEAARREKDRLKAEGYDVWLAGFSTGGNIAITIGREDPDVKGLLLFSPAPFVRTKLVNFVPIASLFINWLISPEKAGGGTTPFKYSTIPMAGLKAYYDTMTAAQDAWKRPYEKPVFVVLSEADSVVDTARTAALADKALANPASRLVWYGDELPTEDVRSLRTIRKSSYLPEMRIRSFSHLAINYSPENPYYGVDGRLVQCAMGGNAGRWLKCSVPEDEVWYGSWGEKRDEHVYVRLNFNPHFEWQTNELLNFLEANK